MDSPESIQLGFPLDYYPDSHTCSAHDKNFPEVLVGPRTGFGVVLQLMQWKAGPMDVSPEGKERIRQKYREVPGLQLIE